MCRLSCSARDDAFSKLHFDAVVERLRRRWLDDAGNGTRVTEAERVDAMRRRGFRRGFFVVLALFALIVTPYVLADQIMENLPQSRETMVQYVAVIDELRASLVTFVDGIQSSIAALTAE